MTRARFATGSDSEDTLLSLLFPAPSGCCLEVGAFDGVLGSTTLIFERRGWRAILVEPLPELAERARVRRRGPVLPVAAAPRDRPGGPRARRSRIRPSPACPEAFPGGKCGGCGNRPW